MEQVSGAAVEAPSLEDRPQMASDAEEARGLMRRGRRVTYAVFQLSLVQASRGRWFYAVLAAAALSGGAMAYASGGVPGLDAASRFRSGLYSAMGLSAYLLPLLGLLVGAMDMAGDQEGGMLHLLAAQAGRRYQIILGKYLGLGTLLVLATGALVAAAGMGLAARGLVFPPEVLAAFWGLTAGLVAVYLGLGLAIGTLSGSRLTALVIALSAWVAAVFLYDLAIFAFLGWGGAGQIPVVMASALLMNPVDAFRVLTIMLLGNLTALGPSGAALMRMVPPPWGALSLGLALVLWVASTLAAAVLSLTRKDL